MAPRISGRGSNTEPVPVSDNGGSLTVDGPLTDTQLRASAVPVSAASLPLPSNAAQETGGNLATIAAKDFATQTTLAALLTELQAKADLLETQPVSAASLPLPSGASTAARQDTGNASLSSIDGKIPASPSQEHTTAASPHAARLTDGTAFYKATTPSDTQPISAASLPLPSGAATGANQVSQTTWLSSIDGELVTHTTYLSSIDVDTGDISTKVGSINTKTPSLGQALMAASTPVAIASDQSAIPVTDNGGSLTVDGTVTANLAAGTNNIGDVDVASIAAGDNNIGNVDIASAIPAGTNEIGKIVAVPLTGKTLTTYATRLTTNTTDTPTSSTAYISSIQVVVEVGGSGSAVQVRTKEGTPKVFAVAATTTTNSMPISLSFPVPCLMTSGIDIVTTGALAASISVFLSYWS